MIQIKVFEGHGNNETEINKWLKGNPNINILSIECSPMYDLYSNITPPTICNQWIATTIVYAIKEWRKKNELR